MSILNELNARVRDYLPLPCFVATAIASINFDTIAQLFDRVAQVIENKLADVKPADDIALIMVDCSPDVAIKPTTLRQEEPDDEPATHDAAVTHEWEVSLLLKAEQLKHLDMVPFLLGVVEKIEGAQPDNRLLLVISELFNNTLDHGVLKLDSTLKNQPDGLEKYFDERSERLANLEAGQIAMCFERIHDQSCDYMKFSVSKSGDGFDFP